MEDVRSDRADRALMTPGSICKGASKVDSEEQMWLRRGRGRTLEMGSNFLVYSRYGPQARAVAPSRSVLLSGFSSCFLWAFFQKLLGRLTGEFC